MDARRRHQRLQELLLLARELERDERAAFLDDACGGEDALRRDIDRLLAHDEDPISFVASPFDDESGRHGLRAGLEALIDDLPPWEETAELPRSIGKFRIRGKLGEGGMGAVYEAEQERPRRTVALKVLRTAFLSADSLRRFEQESEFFARLQHPGIAQIFDFGSAETEHGPQPYFAMELVRGEPLTDYANSAGLSVPARLELLARVADAVQHAHQHGVIHRDLKPANILVDASGRPKVLDFGVARASDSDVLLTTHTNVGQILGTLAYMSPEQASGDPRAIDTRSDVYSLGVLLFELLTDELPYDVASTPLPEAVRAIREEAPRRLSSLRAGVEGDVETIVGKALEKDRGRRYASAAALATDIRHFVRHEPIHARPPSRLYTLGRFVTRNKTVVGAVAIVLVALLVGLIVALRFGLREAAARRELERDRYVRDMSDTQVALEAGEFGVAQKLHDRAPAHLRGWEWHHLDRRWVRELANVSVPEVAMAAYLDDSRIVAVEGSSRAHVWNVLTGEWAPVATRRLGGRALALSADGRWLLAHREGVLALGDPLSVDPPTIIAFPGRTPKARSGTSDVSADGTRVAVATDTNEVIVIDVGGASRDLTAEGSASEVLTVVFSPNARKLAVQRASGLRVWDIDTLGFRDASRRYVGFAFSPDGASLIRESEGVNGQGAGLFQEDVLSLERRGMVPRTEYGAHHYAPCQAVSFSADGGMLAFVYGGTNQLLRLNMAAGSGPESAIVARPLGRLVHPGIVRIAFSPSGASAMSVGLTDETIRLWRVPFPGGARVCRGHGSYVYAVAFSPDGKTLASGAWDGQVCLWDSATGELTARIVDAAGRTHVFGLAFSSDGSQLARITNHNLELLDIARGHVVTALTELPGSSVAYSQDGAWLVGDTRGVTHIWDARTLEERTLREREVHLGPVFALNPTGTLLATGWRSGRVQLVDPSSGTVLAQTDGPTSATYFPGVNALAFAPGGDRLVVGWGNSTVTLHDVPSLAKTREMSDHRREVFAVAFSPDGSRIASGGHDGILRLWDAATGNLLLKLAGHADYIKSLAFSPDGHRIATGSGDETVRVWDGEPVAPR